MIHLFSIVIIIFNIFFINHSMIMLMFLIFLPSDVFLYNLQYIFYLIMVNLKNLNHYH